MTSSCPWGPTIQSNYTGFVTMSSSWRVFSLCDKVVNIAIPRHFDDVPLVLNKRQVKVCFSQLQTLRLKVGSTTVMIFFHIILPPRVLIYDFHIFITSSSSFHGFITNQFNDLLPVGFLAQLVVHCTAIAEVKGSNPVQAGIFSGFLFTIAKIASPTAMIFFHIIKWQC